MCSSDLRDIGVSVDESVVTLRGTVGSYAETVQAERAAARVYGVKAVANNEPYLSRPVHGRPSLPPTILTEAVAQVGAILILAKPENKDQLIFFRGMERVRFRAPVYPGDVVVVEATVKRLRSRMGVLGGRATVNGKVVVDGTMTFALGSE